MRNANPVHFRYKYLLEKCAALSRPRNNWFYDFPIHLYIGNERKHAEPEKIKNRVCGGMEYGRGRSIKHGRACSMKHVVWSM